MRARHRDNFLKKHNMKLGFMSAFVKAAAFALQEQPVVNGGENNGAVFLRCLSVMSKPLWKVVPSDLMMKSLHLCKEKQLCCDKPFHSERIFTWAEVGLWKEIACPTPAVSYFSHASV